MESNIFILCLQQELRAKIDVKNKSLLIDFLEKKIRLTQLDVFADMHLLVLFIQI